MILPACKASYPGRLVAWSETLLSFIRTWDRHQCLLSSIHPSNTNGRGINNNIGKNVDTGRKSALTEVANLLD